MDTNNVSLTSVEGSGTRTVGGYNDGNITRDTNDDIFAVEFNAMMRSRANGGGASAKEFQIPFIPVPDLGLSQPGQGLLYATVQGLNVPYYSALNGQIVEVLRDRTKTYRRALNDGSWQKGTDGKVKLFDYHVDAASYIIRTAVNIRKPNYVLNEDGSVKVDSTGNKVRYVDPKGLAFIDYEDVEGRRYFYYSVPKTCLYKANMTALALSNNPHMANCYYGYKIAFVNGVYYYLIVMNYRRNQNDNTTRVLGISNKVDYTAEIRETLSAWQGVGKYKGQKPFMFDSRITEVPYSNGKISNNVGLMYFRGKLVVEAYLSNSNEPFGEITEGV